MAFLGQEEQVRELQDRFRYFYFGLFLFFGILTARLTYLQILSGDKMRRFSEENRIKRVKIPAPRGMIFDRNRTLLIDNHPSFDLEITPQYLRESGQSAEVIKKLASLLETDPQEIQKRLAKFAGQPSFIPVKIRTDMTRDEVAKIETWKIAMPGVSVETEIQRTNVDGDIAAHLLGYIGPITHAEMERLNKTGKKYELGDSTGKVGIEKQLETILRGVDGQDIVEVDAVGRRIRDPQRGRVLDQSPERIATPGKNIVLTIDQAVQKAAVEAFGEKPGSLVAIDPQNGEIIAMISRPSFDPTAFSRGVSNETWKRLLNDPNKPLYDKSIQDHYPPGSVFKTITAIAGLEEGVVDENTKFNCSGSIMMGNRPFHCHKKGGHGEMNVVSALTQSCDVYFYRVAQKLESVNQIAKWANFLGLGRKTGVELPRESPGLIPTEEWKLKTFKQPWSPGESLSVAIGQGFDLTTAIQLANAYATIANGGTLYQPHYVKAIETWDGQKIKDIPPQVISNVKISAKTLEKIRQGLWGVVNSPTGTTFSNRLPGMDFVGKTGTAQLFSIAKDKIYQKCENMKFHQRHHGLFAGFAPLHNPKIAIAVVAEHACHGGSGAGPVARAAIKTYLEKNFPEEFGEAAIAKKIKESGGSLAYPIKTVISNEEDDVVPGLPGSDVILAPSEGEEE